MTTMRRSPSFRVNNISCSLAGQGRVGVEGAGLAKANRDDVANHLLDGVLPFTKTPWCSNIHSGVGMKVVGEVGVVVEFNNIGCVVIRRELSVDCSLGRGDLVGRTRGLPLGPCRGRGAVHDERPLEIVTGDETAAASKSTALRTGFEGSKGDGDGVSRCSAWAADGAQGQGSQ